VTDARRGEAPMHQCEAQIRQENRHLPLDLSFRFARLENHDYGILLGRDASTRLHNETSLRLAAQVFATSGEGIMITDPQQVIVEVNKTFTRITGYTRAEALGQKPRLLSSGRHDAAFYDQMQAVLRSEGQWSGEIWNRRKSGEIYPEWLSISVIRDEAGVPQNYVATFSDITERKAAEANIRHMALHDYLTGLPNRFLLLDRFNQAVAAAKRDNRQFAVLFVDLDRFKPINDTLGHSVGDRLLCLVADRLTAAIRATDTVSRQGGDEFVVLVAELGLPGDINAIAQKLLQSLSQPCTLQEHKITVTSSIGIAIYPDDGEDLDVLLKHADIALYSAKEEGRNNFQFYRREMNEHALKLLLLENQLRNALERDEFELFYQPQLDLAGNQVACVEALIRWHNPEFGLVPPDDFIPLAEASGLIVPIGQWVLKEACRQIVRWRRSGFPNLRMAVNLSAVQFRQPALVEHVQAALHVAGLEADALVLEVTESVVMRDAESTIQTLNALRALGVTLSIDDFGTGHSSLAYLRRFPIGELKIDRSFIQNITTDTDDAAICSTIIGLARILRINVVAEGVETDAQLDWLRAAGCDFAQGYFLSRPQPAAACQFSMQQLNCR
jgi:diguanylate cyclase (GGDEF)-like protein/PAS domain S-box-containing protein